MNVVALRCFVLAAAWVQETEGRCCFQAFPKEIDLFRGPCCNIFGCNCDDDCWCPEDGPPGNHGRKREAFFGSGTFRRPGKPCAAGLQDETRFCPDLSDRQL